MDVTLKENKSLIVKKLKEIFMETVDNKDIKEETIDMDADLFKVYGLKSVKAIRIISDIEVEYDIDISEEEAKLVCTLNDVIKLIEKKLVKK